MSTNEDTPEKETLESFKIWSIKSLRSFLNQRGKDTKGTIDDLAAR